MGQLEDIERLRKKRNRRQSIKRLGTFLLAVLLFFGILFAWTAIKSSNITEVVTGALAELESGEGYPIEFSSATIRQTETMGNSLLVLTDTHLHIYNRHGKLLRSVEHQFTDPVMKCAGSRILLYDPDSTRLLIESKTGSVREMAFDYPVQFATLSAGGDLAVITNAQRFLGQVVVYSSALGDPIFSWKSAESYLYHVAFSSDGDSIAVAGAQVSEGDLVSGLTMYRLNGQEPFLQKDYVGEAIHDLSCQNGEWQILTDRGAYYYSGSGREKEHYSFNDEPLRAFCTKGDGLSALILGDYQEFKSVRLSFLSGNGEENAALSLQSAVEDMDVCGTNAAVHLGSKILICNAGGEILKEILPEKEVLHIALGNQVVYYVTPDAVCQESIR